MELFQESYFQKYGLIFCQHESPITHVTKRNTHMFLACTSLKELYNKYLMPYWQENIFDENVWKKVNSIPNDKLWEVHKERKQKLIKIVQENISNRLRRSGIGAIEINEIVSGLNDNDLIIGFARRFGNI